MMHATTRTPWGRLPVLAFCLLLLVVLCGREAWVYIEARRFNRLV
jgi:hypothetical protein